MAGNDKLEISNDDVFYTYTNTQRIKETKRIKNQKSLQKYKDKKGMSEVENKLSDYNSKTCDIDKFVEYIKNKLEVNNELFEEYLDTKFRKRKFQTHINSRRSDAKLLDMIENKFGRNIVIIMGDWSIGKQMRNFISTPNLRLKRLLTQKFIIYNIDEYRTSCLHHKTEEQVENLKVKDWFQAKKESKKGHLYNKDASKNKEFRELHSVLTFKMENNRKGCINRDRNACYNMRKIYKHYLETGKRPDRYCRGNKTQQEALTTS
jgi:hypothetical protein